MSLKYAILGFLSLHPMTGYDLKTNYFDGSVGKFWPADQAQIYRTLDKLSDEGWVESSIEVQTIRPNRKIYTITNAGLEGLKRWLAENRPLPKERIPFLVQLYFGRHLSAENLLTLLHSQRQKHIDRLTEYQQLELPTAEDEPMLTQLKFGAMTLDYGLRLEKMRIEWLNDIIEQLEKEV